MSTMASQITSLTIVCSTVYSGTDQRKYQAPRHWPLCGEFTGDRCIPRKKRQWASNAENVSLMTPSWRCIRHSNLLFTLTLDHRFDCNRCFHDGIYNTRRRQLYNHFTVKYMGSELSITAWISNFSSHFIMQCNYLSVLGLKSIHVSKRDPWYLDASDVLMTSPKMTTHREKCEF